MSTTHHPRYFRPRTKTLLSKKLVRLRIVKPWGNYRVGAEIEPPAGAAELLVERGFAEPVEAKAPAKKKRAPRKKTAAK